MIQQAIEGSSPASWRSMNWYDQVVISAWEEDDDRQVVVAVGSLSKVFPSRSTDMTVKERLLVRSSSLPGYTALQNVSFEVREGETFGILGHNGSGKSTLLKVLARILRPTSGSVHTVGRVAALLELGSGFHPDLSGGENIYLNGSILGFSRDFVSERYEAILSFAELEKFQDVPVRHYSSGMRARLGFSVATHLQPDILLVDEVLAVGDEAFQEKCMERVHAFRKSGRTMLLVSHSTARIHRLCDRAAVLDAGQLVYVGEPADAVDAYRQALGERHQKRTASPGHSPVPSGPERLEAERSRPFSLGDCGLELADGADGQEANDTSVEVQMRPAQGLGFWADVEADREGLVRMRVVLRDREGLVLVDRSTAQTESGPLRLEVGTNRVSFRFNRLPLTHGTYSLDLFLESKNGKTQFDYRSPLGVVEVVGGRQRVGPLLTRLEFSVDGPAATAPATIGTRADVGPDVVASSVGGRG